MVEDDANTLQLDKETLPAAFYDGHELARLYEDGNETHGLEGCGIWDYFGGKVP